MTRFHSASSTSMVRSDAPGDARRADEDVEAAELLLDARDRRVELGRARDVAGDAERAAELVRSRLHARGIEIEDGDAASARLDAPGARRADAARPAGDEGDAPVEVHGCHWQRV